MTSVKDTQGHDSDLIARVVQVLAGADFTHLLNSTCYVTVLQFLDKLEKAGWTITWCSGKTADWRWTAAMEDIAGTNKTLEAALNQLVPGPKAVAAKKS